MMIEKEKKETLEHISVMSDEVIDALNLKEGQFIIDGTFGGGGHSKLICEKISHGTLLALDRDPKAYERALNFKCGDGVKIIAKNANYSQTLEVIKEEKLPLANGLLLDLGFSSLQLEEGRGFSFMKDEPLLMTYSDDMLPLKDALRQMTKEEIANIIYEYSGERFSRRIADAIYTAERKKKIETTGELVEVIKSVMPRNYERGRIHPATRTFLAFRIFINHELEHLKKVLSDIPQIIQKGGRVVIITFQSLEDKLVKESFKALNKEGIITLFSKKPIAVSEIEAKNNPRARSAKMRAAIIN